MARKATKVNPVKKTYYVERATLTKLAYLAKQDGRSESTYFERLVEAAWKKQVGKKS